MTDAVSYSYRSQAQTSATARIKKLSPLLINQLSAGEVVTRPASVVKELLENAIDANATKIIVNITQGGMGLIELIDNGDGIHPDDMLMAVTRHATSKVADVEHLQGINTLGFRGEALASISAVSRLTLISSHDDSGIGRCLNIAGEVDNPDITPIACQQGTQVSVRDLYFNVPARRGNLKSIATEYAHIEAVIRHIALVYRNLDLTLHHDGKCRLTLLNQNKVLNLFGSESEQYMHTQLPSLTRLQQALSTPLPSKHYNLFVDLSALYVPNTSVNIVDTDKITTDKLMQEDVGEKQQIIDSFEKNPPSIRGWFWLADKRADNSHITESRVNRSNSHKQGNAKANVSLPTLIYINDRLVKDLAISHQLRQSILSVNLDINQVGYALFFNLPSAWLNLNVHPSKQRISIHTLANINAHLHVGIQQLLQPVTLYKKQLYLQETAQQGQDKLPEKPAQSGQIQQQALHIAIQKESKQQTQNNTNITPKQTIRDLSTDHNFYKLKDKTRSQLASPNSVYQLDKKETRVSSCQPSNCFQLLIITEQLDSPQQLEQLNQQLQQSLGLTCAMEVQPYKQLEATYQLSTQLTLDTEQALKQLIKLTDCICSSWTVAYQRELDEVTFTFDKSQLDKRQYSCFRQAEFEAIAWAHIEKNALP